ncbi:uncharacterized protein BDZ99DRAFT_399963 [Mytilinidion resinicola]|uniref:DUF6590 domain-containing protein n=1 Tax=Mytilinidion resinicola TaxID=574789 RepID=A0A6A6Y3I7_9PEZI|nr:uncharacterized protein BDZ99DRAFT_399963 [Mytilinidion resinicola]KAF2803220.1 hypothetical protein BDZ99DRAFT_399963 [Mytilinidion resinicola]
MLWTEPAGVTPGKTRGSTHFSLIRFNETAYSEIRRFIVISNKGQYSQCIPIQTYRGQGTRKHGIVVEDHSLIYTGDEDDEPPELLPGERITKQPLRVEPTGSETLESASRVNFGKVYTVEHNVKVLDIGVVCPQHIYLLVNYFTDALTSV